MVKPFQNDHPHGFAQNKAIAVEVKRPTRPVRLAVKGGGEGAHGRKTRQSRLVDDAFYPTRNHSIGTAVAD